MLDGLKFFLCTLPCWFCYEKHCYAKIYHAKLHPKVPIKIISLKRYLKDCIGDIIKVFNSNFYKHDGAIANLTLCCKVKSQAMVDSLQIAFMLFLGH